MPTRPGHGRFNVFAEAQHHAAAALVDDVETAEHPDQQRNQNDQPEAAAPLPHGRRAVAAGRSSAAKYSGKFLIELAQNLVEIRRAIAALFTPLRVI